MARTWMALVIRKKLKGPGTGWCRGAPRKLRSTNMSPPTYPTALGASTAGQHEDGTMLIDVRPMTRNEKTTQHVARRGVWTTRTPRQLDT